MLIAALGALSLSPDEHILQPLLSPAATAVMTEVARSLRPTPKDDLVQPSPAAAKQHQDDPALVQAVFDWLGKEETDMTIFFRSLADVVTTEAPPSEMPAAAAAAFYGAPPQEHLDAGAALLQRWWHRTRREHAAPLGCRTEKAYAALPLGVVLNLSPYERFYQSRSESSRLDRS